MSSHHGHHHIDYVCVDERAEFIHGSAGNFFYHVVADPRRVPSR